MSELLFGRLDGGLDLAVLAFSILGSLALCAALFLLGRRNEIGWWLAAGAYVMWAVSSLLTFSPANSGSLPAIFLFLLGITIPAALGIVISAYGMFSFRKFPLTGPSTRDITLRAFKGSELALPAMTAVIFGLAACLPLLAVVASLGVWQQFNISMLGTVVIGGVIGGLLPAGLLGLAQRGRWAWFLLMAPPLLDMYATVMIAGGSVKIFLSILTLALAALGWGRWGAITSAPAKNVRAL